jgi:hypothetical protein
MTDIWVLEWLYLVVYPFIEQNEDSCQNWIHMRPSSRTDQPCTNEHATVDQYLRMIADIGQFEQAL